MHGPPLAQVRALGEETGRLKSKATDAVARAEREEASRRAAESQLAQLRAQVICARGKRALVVPALDGVG